MNIAVILRQVPDTEAVIRPDSSKPGRIHEADLKFVLNPYDEYAVEEAIRIKEKSGGEVVGFCIGPNRSESSIRSAMAVGMDKAVLITDPAAVEADVVTQGRILAAAIKGFSPTVIFCGRDLIDTQDDGMAAIVAHFLDIPHVLNAAKVTIEGDKATVVREVEGASLELEVKLPAAISCSKALNEPRYAKILDIKRAKAKELKKVTLAELGVGPFTSKTRLVDLKLPPSRPKGIRVAGEPAVVAGQGVEWLSKTAKVI